MTDTCEIEREKLIEWWGAMHEGRLTLQVVLPSGDTLDKMEATEEEIVEILDEQGEEIEQDTSD